MKDKFYDFICIEILVIDCKNDIHYCTIIIIHRGGLDKAAVNNRTEKFAILSLV